MNQFVRYLLLINFLFFSFLLKAQFDNKKYDKEFFLIGTLNEYMGYQRTFSKSDYFYYQRIDIMSKNDLKYALFIDSLFSVDYKDITIVNNGAPQGIKMYSPTLSKRVDDFYDYSPGSTFTGQMDTVYSGKLKKQKFVTDKQIYSFLLGAYLRYGEDKNRTNIITQLLKKENKIDSAKLYENECYAFNLPNAPSKAKLCGELLKGLGCESVDYIYRTSIPAGHFVIFNPTRKMIDVINDAKLLSAYIETINTDKIEFTPNGTKFIWKEPDYPSRK